MANDEVEPLSSRNLRFSLAAVQYVKSRMTIGSAYGRLNPLRGGLTAHNCVNQLKSINEKYEGFFWDPHLRRPSRDAYLRQVAMQATVFECGNCEEQVAVAWVYLCDRGVTPLDLMSVGHAGGFFSDGDHTFIVIGRKDKNKLDPNSWGPEAVICDPAYERAYPSKQYKGSKFPWLKLRLD